MWFTDIFSQQIWEQKYAGEFTDVKKYYENLARIVSLGDVDDEQAFFKLMWSKKFSPGGRILAAAGRPAAKMSLMNCTTHRITDDSLKAISDTAYSIMTASSRGQGIGIDLSKLRPFESPVNNAAVTSTGSISFMEMLNTVGGTIGQAGRRGALLFSLSVDHPDLYRVGEDDIQCPKCGGVGCQTCDYVGHIPYDFLHVKKIPGKVENANISVRILDDFMHAVRDDLPWELKFTGISGKTPFRVSRFVQARELFHEIAKSAWASAEPGILYWSTSERYSTSNLFGERWKVVGVNACSEQVLDQDGVCLLGSMNLASYVVNPFTGDTYFDTKTFKEDVKTAVRFLDNVIDVELHRGSYVSETQKESLINLRRIGLGVMGLADMLAMSNLSYGDSYPTITFLNNVFGSMRDAAYEESIELAQSRGAACVWRDTQDYRGSIVDRGFYSTLPAVLQEKVRRYGTRNVALLSIAPTGTISNLYGVSSGIEPIYAAEYVRRVRMSGHTEFVNYVHPGIEKARSLGLPDSIYPTAYKVSPSEHLLIQAIAQRFVDSSISKTVNLPASTTVEDVERLYMLAWESGLKGLSIYRDGSRDVQVLYTESAESERCPECDGMIINDSGCKLCTSCGYSVCSV